MGCDIHGYIEVLVDKDYSSWDFVMREPGSDDFRWYALFARFFGVRNSYLVSEMWPDRGLPEKVSDDVIGYYESWKGDAHSESWVGWWELKPFLEAGGDGNFRNSEWYSEGYAVLFDCMGRLGEKYGDNNVRWVVWFDN